MRKADLCRVFGLDPKSSLMSSYEKGRSDPSYDKCEKLIRLGITAQELFGEELGKILIENSLEQTPGVIPPEIANDPEFQAGLQKAIDAKVDAAISAKLDDALKAKGLI